METNDVEIPVDDRGNVITVSRKKVLAALGIDDTSAKRVGELEFSVKHMKWERDNLRAQLGYKDHALMRKNRELDALHYVWCIGGCRYGTHRYAPMHDVELTEEMVEHIELQAKRMRSWFGSVEFKKKWGRIHECLGRVIKDEGIQQWWQTPVPRLGGVTPYHAVFHDHRIDDVLAIAESYVGPQVYV